MRFVRKAATISLSLILTKGAAMSGSEFAEKLDQFAVAIFPSVFRIFFDRYCPSVASDSVKYEDISRYLSDQTDIVAFVYSIARDMLAESQKMKSL